MTSYNGQSITYDEIGNPLTYRDGMTMTWTGRQLTTLTQNGKQNTYKYDVDGLRLEKTAGGVTTQYQYVNGQLLGEKRSNGVILRYTYDALGVLSGIQYKNTAGVTTNYIVRCTLSGDVDQIFDTKGSLVGARQKREDRLLRKGADLDMYDRPLAPAHIVPLPERNPFQILRRIGKFKLMRRQRAQPVSVLLFHLSHPCLFNTVIGLFSQTGNSPPAYHTAAQKSRRTFPPQTQKAPGLRIVPRSPGA